MTAASSTIQKINLNSCTHEQVFKALACVDARLATATVKDNGPYKIAHPVRHVSDMSEYYIPSASDTIQLTRLGNPKVRDWLPSEFGPDGPYWTKKGLAPGKLLSTTYLNPQTGAHSPILQTMTGVAIDIFSPGFQASYQNFIGYPTAIHLETQSKIYDIVSEYFEKEFRTGRQKLGHYYAIEWLQHIKVTVQNKLMIRRTAINTEIIAWIAQPLRSNQQVQLFGDRLALLVSMKERAQGLPFRSLDEEIAHSIITSQTETEKETPFPTEQSRLDMARLLAECNRDIELGNDIDLDILLTRIGNVFPPQAAPMQDDTLHAALHAATSHGNTYHRRNEQQDHQHDQESKTYKGKRKQDSRDASSEEQARWDKMFKMQNDFMAQLGGFRKILADNNLKEKPPVPSTKPPKTGKENGQEQNSGDQKSAKFAGTASKGKANKSKFAPSYLPVRQETNSESEPEEEQSASLASVKKIPKRIDYRAMNAHYCNAAQDGSWSKPQLADGDSLRYSRIASMCLDDDDLVGNHLTSEGPPSSPQDPMMSNPLSLYASFLAFQEQHPKSGCERLIISALRNSSDDKLDGKMGDPSPLLSLSELPYSIREVSDNEPEPQPSPQPRPMTRRETRISSCVWPTVYEPPTDDESDCDKSLVEPAPVKTPAAVGKSTPRRSLLKSADRLRGNTIVSAAGAAIKAKNQWDVTEDEEIPDPPRSTPKTVGAPRLRSGGRISD